MKHACGSRSASLAVAVLLFASVAQAQETSEETTAADEGAQQRAQLHFQSGASYYEAGSYEDALREWTRAYELSNRTELLYNLSLAHQGLNQLTEARDYLRRFLDEVEDIPNRANLELRIQNLDRRIAEQESDPDTQPAPPPDAVPPSETSPDASPVGGSGATSSSDSGGYVSPGAIGGFVGAGVGVAMFGLFGALTVVEDGRLSDLCGATPCAQGTANDLRTFALLADIGIGVAVAGGVLGLIFLLVDTGPSEADVAAAPWVTEDGGGFALGGRF